MQSDQKHFAFKGYSDKKLDNECICLCKGCINDMNGSHWMGRSPSVRQVILNGYAGNLWERLPVFPDIVGVIADAFPHSVGEAE